MIVLKIIEFVAGIFFLSFWLVTIIAIGISSGLKLYFNKDKKEDSKNDCGKQVE